MQTGDPPKWKTDKRTINVTKEEKRAFKFLSFCYSYGVPVFVARDSKKGASV